MRIFEWINFVHHLLNPMKSILTTLAMALLCFNLAFSAGGGRTYRLPAGVTADDYQAQTLILRVDPAYRSICQDDRIAAPAFDHVVRELGQVRLFKVFPRHQPPASPINEYGQKLVDLSLIYQLEYSGQADLLKTVNAMLSTGIFVYAEPKFIPKTQYNPNDPSTGTQYFLNRISAYAGWDIHKGDSTTVIGITDTGTDTDHPDLQPNIRYNYADPINGVDDDNDGYIDNFQGWDLGENDNDPQVNASAHGSHVSGCAAAVTDNGTGVASPGFYCRFLPVKISNSNGSLTMAYEGIVYAADMGCHIINCSWGSAGGSSFGQNIVDYATFNKNSLVVAAAGNNGANQDFFPAAYQNVLAVASTGLSDTKSSFSNFGSFIDVCAPGSTIYSAQFDNAYASQSGTSMASPVAAGVAAVVKSYIPSLNALQVGEKVRVTCDNIYTISGNASYQNQLGKGRVNMLNALTISSPAVRMNDLVITDYNDNVLVVNDTIRITGNITNYLDPTSNLVVTLTTTSSYVTILDGTTTVGALATMASTNNNADPFVVKINPNAPLNSQILFKLLFQDGLYNDYQMFSVTVNVDYLNITINEVLTTNSSKGRICYNNPGQLDGLGFDYNSDGSLAYETGFMVGISGNVADNVRGASAGATDEDFQSVVNIQKHEPGIWSDFDTYGSFNDNSNSTPLGLKMDYRTLSWIQVPWSKFHIFEYTIRNTGNTTRSNVYAGIFSDWDIQNYANNKAAEDAALQMGYVFCTDPGGYFAGIKLLTPGGFRHYAIDNVTGGGGGADLSDGYSDTEKYTSLSSNRATAGGTGAGNDVIDVVGTGPFTLAPGDSVVVAFALIAGNELSDLQSSAAQAQVKYNLTTGLVDATGAQVLKAYPNPASESVLLPFALDQADRISMELYTVSGTLVHARSCGNLAAGVHEIRLDTSVLPTGVYHVRLFGERTSRNGTIVVSGTR
jgi:subtilisin family serine protease